MKSMNSRRNIRAKTCLLTLAILFWVASFAPAVTYTWSGMGGDAFINTPGNWVGGTAPNFLSTSGADSLVFNNNVNTNVIIPTSLMYSQTGTIINLTNVTFGADAGAFTFAPDPSAPPPTVGTTNTYILTLYPAGAALTNSSTNVQTFNGDLRDRNSATLNAANAGFVVSGYWNIGTGSSSRGPLTIAGDHDVTLGSISGGAAIDGGSANLIKNGNGRLYLNADGTRADGPNGFWNGQITINAGALRIQTNHGLGAGYADSTTSGRTYIGTSASHTGRLELNNGIDCSERLFLKGRTVTDLSTHAAHIVNVSGANTLSGTIENNSTGQSFMIDSSGMAMGDSLTISASITNSSTSVFMRDLAFRGDGNGTISGSILTNPGNPAGSWNVYKYGGGTWTLTSAGNNYTGSTIVGAGTLAVSGDGTIASSTLIDVRSGATLNVSGTTLPWTLSGTQTLKGGGTVLGNVTTSAGSIVAPGGSVGTLTIGALATPANLTLNDGGTLQYELSNLPGGTNDKIVVHGDLTLLGTTAVTVTAANSFLGSGNYPLIQYDGAISGNAANFNLIGTPTGTRQSFSLSTTTLPKQVTLNVVGNVKNLIWSGGQNSNTWDMTSPTYKNFKEINPNDQNFYNADFITFNDTGNNATPVLLSGDLAPGSVTFANNSKNYRLEGLGALVGPAGLNVSGTGKVTIANSGYNTFSGTIAIDSGTLAFDRTDSVTVSNAITGTGTLRQEGTGILTLAGNNTGFSGTIVVPTGRTLQAGAAASLGAAVTTVESGGTFDANGQDLRTATNATINAAGTGVAGLGAIVDARLVDGARSELGSVVLGDHTTIGVYSAGNYLDIWALQGNNKNLTKIGVGKVDLVNLGDSGLGNIYINEGDLSIETSTTLGNEDSGQKVYLAGGASLSLWNSTPAHTKPIEVAASGGSIITGNGNNKFNSPITLNGDLTVAGTAGSIWFSGDLTGSGGLVKSDARTLYLESDNNTYTGVTTINGGIITVGANGLTGSIGPNSVVVNTGGTLRFLKATTYSVNNQISGDGGVNYDAAAGVATINSDSSYNGPTAITAGTVKPAHANAFGSTYGNTSIGSLATPASNATLSLSGGITLSEPLTLIGKYQTGYSTALDTNHTPHILNVSGNNTLTGLIVADSGNSSSRNLINLRSDGGLLKIGDGLGTFDGVGSGGRRLHLFGAGNGELANVINGSFRIIKHDTGTWTLSNNNAFMNGDMWIYGGTMALAGTGTLNAASDIVLYGPSATFDASAVSGTTPYALGMQNLIGTGIFKGNFTGDAATLSPSGTGTGVGAYNTVGGTMTIQGNYTTGYASAFKFKLTSDDAGSQNDKINVTGTLTLLDYNNPTIHIVPSTSLETGGTYTLLTAANPIVFGTGSAFNLDTWSHQTRYGLSLDLSDNTKVKLNVSGTNKSLTWAGIPAAGTTADWDIQGYLRWKDAAMSDEQYFQADAVRFDDSISGAATTVNLTATAYYPASITVDSAQDYTFSGTGVISSDTGITKRGSGKLTINTSGLYTGTVTVEGGTLVVGHANALGYDPLRTNGTVINGGTLEMNGKMDRFERLSVQGAGVGDNGALINSTMPSNNYTQRVHYVALTGDASIGGSQPFNIENNSGDGAGPAPASYLQGNNYALTKVGANTVSLVNLGETNLGDINLNAGILALSGNTTLGNNAMQVNLAAGGRLTFTDTTVTHTKPIVATGGRLDTSTGTSNLTSPITLNGDLVVTTSADVTMTLSGSTSGSGGLNKGNPGKVILAGVNTYQGATQVTTGTLELASTGQISTLSTITNNAVFQVNGGSHPLGVISGTGTMNVMGASVVTATSITQDTLTIGGAAPAAVAAVPEPATWSLLLIGLLAATGISRWWKR